MRMGLSTGLTKSSILYVSARSHANRSVIPNNDSRWSNNGSINQISSTGSLPPHCRAFFCDEEFANLFDSWRVLVEVGGWHMSDSEINGLVKTLEVRLCSQLI